MPVDYRKYRTDNPMMSGATDQQIDATFGGVQSDPRGVNFRETPGGERTFISDGIAPDHNQSFLHQRPEWNPETGNWDRPINWNNLITAGTAGLVGAGAASAFMGGGGGLTSTSGLSGEVGLTSQAAPVGGTMANSAATASATGAGKMGIGSSLAKYFMGSGGKGGVDPTSLVMAILSMFGDNGQQRGSFEGSGLTDPHQAANNSAQSIYRLGQGLTEANPVKLRSSYVQPGPAPVQIPGLNFQIGGGLGRDPALDHPELLEDGGGNPFKYDPFQSLDQAGANGNSQSSAPGARRRNPNG